jgi:hypothetical protein
MNGKKAELNGINIEIISLILIRKKQTDTTYVQNLE